MKPIKKFNLIDFSNDPTLHDRNRHQELLMFSHRSPILDVLAAMAGHVDASHHSGAAIAASAETPARATSWQAD